MGLVVLTLFAQVAASGTDVRDQAVAEFRKGQALFQKMAYEDAATAFRSAYRLKPSWKIFYNIAQCEAAAKHHGRALEAFEAYLSQGGDDIDPERRQKVLEEIDALRKYVGMVEIDAPNGAFVIIDNERRGATPLPGPIPVSASVEHTLLITHGETQFEKVIKVMGQQTLRVSYTPEILESTATPASTAKVAPLPSADRSSFDSEPDRPTDIQAKRPASKGMSFSRKAGFVMIGVGAGILLAGAATGILAISKDNKLEKRCTPSCTTNEARQDLNTVDRLALSTDILLPVGGAVAVAGLLLATVLSKKTQRETSRVAVSPLLDRQMGGLSIRWSYQ